MPWRGALRPGQAGRGWAFVAGAWQPPTNSMVGRCENVLRTARMKHNRNQLGISDFSRVARDSMQAARRLLERFAGLVDLGGFVISSQLVRAFDDIYKRRPGMAM